MIAHRRRKNVAPACHGSVSRAARRRSGATLIEVLMSLLIMGIGVTSVISIFPIAWLRSIQATQLTNARMMRHNAEQLFRQPLIEGRVPAGTYPSPRFEYRVLNQSTYRGATAGSIADVDNQIFRGTWQPNTAYRVGQIVLATRREGELNPAQNRWFVCFSSSVDPQWGMSGYVEPNWNITPFIFPGVPLTDDTADGQLVWRCYTQAPIGEPFQDISVGGSPYSALNYVVDPLGWNVYEDESSDIFPTMNLANDFGYKVDRGSGIGNSITTAASYDAANPLTWPLLRMNGGATTVNDATFLASHPDSWTAGTSSVIDAFTSLTATFPAKIDLSDVVVGDRIVLTSLTNTVGVTRTISTLTAPSTVGWVEPLPAGFTADGPARIEKYNRLYTWLATVNKDLQGNSKVTVAVFSKRGFKPAEEHIYNANFGNTATGGVWPAAGDQVHINWDPTTEPDPLIRAGNYLLDGTYARWYRIVTSSGGNGSATITVDRPIPMAQVTADATTLPGRAILMRGIVELFEL